ncbi:MAG: sulfotransferase family 2 domain-containing protein [Myxococcota bacterium]|nr:sulfotransferase family 2 domain-containing protein [Myxococcota bacterium]
MPVAVHGSEPRFLFFWNNKVASRSVLAGLRKAFPDLGTYSQPAFRPLLPDAHWPRFLIVRNPWARVVSCYRNKCVNAPRNLEAQGRLEPCQYHILRALGASQSPPQAAAAALAELSLADFISALEIARDGNSHFRLQVDVLRDGSQPTSQLDRLLRSATSLSHIARTHYRTPGWLRPGLNGAHIADSIAGLHAAPVKWIQLESFPEAWTQVEQELGRDIAFPWRNSTGEKEAWRDLYDAETTAAVGQLYQPDIEAFGYRPD